MNPLIGESVLVLGLALLMLYACAGGQVVHGYLRVMHSSQKYRTIAILYEAAILVHLVSLSLFVAVAMVGLPEPQVPFFGNSFSLYPMMWINVPVACIALFVTLFGLGGKDGSRLQALVELVFALCCTPAVILLMENGWVYVLYADAIYSIFRIIYQLVNDKRQRRQHVSGLSVIEALQRLPDGLLYATVDGRIIMLNDSMRHCLTALQLPTDFANALTIWSKLEESADPVTGGELERAEENGLLVDVGADEVRLFTMELFDAKRPPYVQTPHAEYSTVLNSQGRPIKVPGAASAIRIIAYDVTSEVELLREIERSNQELAASHDELAKSLVTVRQAAENEAMLRMRTRVHDVIGQRLSMLHRVLEDQSLDEEQIERMKPLLSGILDDLALDDDVSPADDLAATVNAFSLAGITVTCKGNLPERDQDARLFANCIREAATNAVKHAQAEEVIATITPTRLVVENGGRIPSLPIEEGTGLANMRRTVESAGGALTLDVSADRFAIVVDLA